MDVTAPVPPPPTLIGGAGTATPWTPTRLAGRRRPRARLAGAAAIVLTGTVAGWVLAGTVAHRSPVLMTSRSLAAGHVLTGSDLRTIEVADADSLHAVSAAGIDTTLGRTLAFPLPAGALITPQSLGPAVWPPQGQGVVAVPLKAGAGPTVEPGQTVSLILLPDPTTVTGPNSGDAAATQPATPVTGVVASVEYAAPSDPTARVVSVVLDRDLAVAVAAAAADGRVALVLLGPS
jgi:hypothetical protein